VQTFFTIWWLRYLSRSTSVTINGIQFLFATLNVAIGFGIHTHPEKNEYFAAPIPYWCWVGNDFKKERYGMLYGWYWVTLGVSLVLYLLLFLLHHKIFKPGTSWYMPKADITLPTHSSHMRLGNSSTPGESSHVLFHAVEPEEPSRKDQKLWSTILYPAIYCVIILPFSIVRWSYFGKTHPVGSRHWPELTLITANIYSLSGVLNALLYLFTRASFFQPARRREPGAPTIKMMREHQ